MKEIGDVELSAVSPIGEKEKPQFLDIQRNFMNTTANVPVDKIIFIIQRLICTIDKALQILA